MLVSGYSYELKVTVKCQDQEWNVTETSGTSRKYTYKVPEYSNIKIYIKNVGGDAILLTNYKKNESWNVRAGNTMETLCSQQKGESKIEFTGQLSFELEFIN